MYEDEPEGKEDNMLVGLIVILVPIVVVSIIGILVIIF
jgi:hypothetical protein